MLDQAELDRRFDHHPPDGVAAEAHSVTRAAYKVVASEVVARLPEGREQALALTHLEESLMWANAAIARNYPTTQ